MNRDSRAVDQQQIDKMRLQILLQQGLTAILTNISISSITAVVLYPLISSMFVIIWVSLSMVVNLLRLLLLQRLKLKLAGNPSADAVRFYENSYAFALLISGGIWGMLGWQFDPTLPLTQQLIIPLVVAGMSAGSVFSHLSSIRSFCAFVMPMILPVAIGIFLAGLEWEALTTFVYLISISILVNNLHHRLIDSLGLRHENSRLVADLTDINKEQSVLLRQLQEKENFLLHTFEEAGVPMLLIDREHQILDVNKAACELFGYCKKEMQSLRSIELLHEDVPRNVSPYFDELLSGKIDQYKITRRFASRSGKTLWLLSTLSAVRNDESEVDYVVMQSQDITQEYVLSQNLQYQAQHDALTGLPNRIALEDRLQEVLQQQDDEHVFCYLDLDQFKVINDTCGHIAGDALLCQISDILKTSLRQSDMLARFSGDEFAVLMPNCSLARARELLDQVLSNIRNFTFEYESHRFKVSASFGLVAIKYDSSLIDVLKQADSACYAAKEAGRDRVHVYSADDIHLVQRNGEMLWVSRIQQALAQQKLLLYSQPIIATHPSNKSWPHYELLIRMQDDDGGIIAPGNFLPAAERYNLAAAIDMWTVEHVLSRLHQARKQGRDIRGIYAINLSGQSLGDSRFYEKIITMIQAEALAESDAVLCFEITETAAITNMRSALLFISELRKVGCLFALDDFGSGLSSFAYLKQLPIDYLKIDGMFVKDCISNTVNLEIINSINGIGQVMGLKTVAEFVEDNKTLAMMKQLGIDYVQGFHLGKPEPWSIPNQP
ncbi:putative bifunctional diguanylate cyclase/phosphodiesterase [Methylophaga sp. OBS4]|uniref:putative bifunctional diguanylate cyclase/phosphodiesterase n=1 Tax=Methylophaga sp. OBS4 TaxID=2991935 RepID=UPI00224ED2A4|nr:EAL domain-containing protein [Methylophaga sp. OBS4]MCX4186333.1 EAL domain-containing protein [Methylophaga sp. OBS4]